MTGNAIDNVMPTEGGLSHELLERLRAGELTSEERDRLVQYLQSDETQGVALAYSQASFSGPLPPPQLLAQYDSQTRRAILEMAQAEQRHAHDMDRKGLEAAVQKDRRGQRIGGGIAITGLIAAAVIAPFSPAAAAIIGGLDLFGMVALFVAPRILPALRRNGEESGDQ